MDVGQGVCQPALRVDVIELAGLDERVADGCAFAAFLGAEKQIVLSANRYGPHGALCGIVIEFQKTMFQIRPHLRDTRQAISDRARQWGLA